MITTRTLLVLVLIAVAAPLSCKSTFKKDNLQLNATEAQKSFQGSEEQRLLQVFDENKETLHPSLRDNGAKDDEIENLRPHLEAFLLDVHAQRRVESAPRMSLTSDGKWDVLVCAQAALAVISAGTTAGSCSSVTGAVKAVSLSKIASGSGTSVGLIYYLDSAPCQEYGPGFSVGGAWYWFGGEFAWLPSAKWGKAIMGSHKIGWKSDFPQATMTIATVKEAKGPIQHLKGCDKD